MKKIIATLLAMGLLTNVIGCGSQPAADVSTTVEESVVTEEAESIEEETTEASTEEVVEEDVEGVNLLSNGDYSNGSENWATFITKGGVAEFSSETGAGVVDIFTTGVEDYSVQLYYDGFGLKMGGVYELQFDISSTIPRNAEIIPRNKEVRKISPHLLSLFFSFTTPP